MKIIYLVIVCDVGESMAHVQVTCSAFFESLFSYFAEAGRISLTVFAVLCTSGQLAQKFLGHSLGFASHLSVGMQT